MGHTEVTCNTCRSTLGYGNPMVTVYRDDKGITRLMHVPGNPVYDPKDYIITECKYCNSTDISEVFYSDE